MIGVGIIGCGKIAQTRHIPEYMAHPQVTLEGYYDVNLERAEKLAEQFGGKAYGSVEELLKNPKIEAVSICVANHAHAEITIKALNAQKHVLCEKPMATNLEDCEAMVLAAEQNKKYLMIDQNQRMARAHMKAKELLEKGEIGKLLSFRTVFGHGGPEEWSIDSGASTWFFDKKKAVMGAMADLGIHKTDLIQYLTGARVVETTAIMHTLDKKDKTGCFIAVEDNAICIYKMENGIIGVMEASWTHYGEEDNSTMLYGTTGIMKIYSNPEYAIEIVNKNGEKIYYDLEKIQTNDHQTKSGIIDEFIAALINDREPFISGKEILSTMRVIFASLESAQKGRPVLLKWD